MQTTPLAPWCFRCPHCGTWAADLPLRVNESSDEIDEPRREKALKPLREHNNRLVLDRLVSLGVTPGMTLLDVGTAHGWFLGQAAGIGLSVVGIEPDSAVADRAQSEGYAVRRGFFPEVLDGAEIFHVISFNDVLEHIPDVPAAIGACHRHLRPGGLLSINIPTSSGLAFRLSVALRRAGILDSPFERLWQVGLPSPHLWYFAPDGLTRLCARQGFDLVLHAKLQSLQLAGLWDRAHYDRSPSPRSVMEVAAAGLAAPLLNSKAGSDIMHLVFRRPG